MVTITQEDLTPVLDSHSGGKVFAQVLDGIASNDELLRALARYIHFNSPFGGGVASLAGEIAVRVDLFRDPNEPLGITADRSVEVASKIFFAAIDDFADSAAPHTETHRTLAQATLKRAGEFFGYDPAVLNSVARINRATFDAIIKVRNGYAVSRSVDEHSLFRALGFHMGSEMLAVEEFRLLDGFLRKKYSALADYLEKTKVKINSVQHVAYYWVRRHTTVEAEHFAAAVAGASAALQYYAGLESKRQIKEWILGGFAEFASVQTEFMNGLLES
ncbi:MAG: hypothetical protein HY001_01820 [Candidatus Portnoybacteria bacterium]|nr:hypothetical protein [Candidatus Portnoybacteria bacterium]